MRHILVNIPQPVPPPQPTYDLIGLTEDEMQGLRALTGKLIWDDKILHDVHEKLKGALGGDYSTYSVKASSGYVGTLSLHTKPR